MIERNLKHHFIWISCLFLSAFSCTKKASNLAKLHTETVQNALLAEPQILFLHLKIAQQDKNAPVIALVFDKKNVNGLLDKPLQGVQLLEGFWLINFLDVEQKIVAQEVVKDPINEHYEYLNEKEKLDNVTVVKKEADCFVRVQFDPRFQYIKGEFILAKNELKPIFQIKF
jgi:hypothetical protein